MNILKLTKKDFFNKLLVPLTSEVYFITAVHGEKNTLNVHAKMVDPLNIKFNYSTVDDAMNALFDLIESRALIGDDVENSRHEIFINTKRGFGNVVVDDTYLTYMGQGVDDMAIKILKNDKGEYAIISIEDCSGVDNICGIEGYFVKIE